MIQHFLKSFTIAHAFITAAFVTATVLLCVRLFASPEKREIEVTFLKENPFSVIWIFLGVFTTIMILLGFVDVTINGYGDGDLF